MVPTYRRVFTIERKNPRARPTSSESTAQLSCRRARPETPLCVTSHRESRAPAARACQGWLRSYYVMALPARLRSCRERGFFLCVRLGSYRKEVHPPEATSPRSRLTPRATLSSRAHFVYAIQRFVASNTASALAVSALSLISQLPVNNADSRATRAVTPTKTNSRSNAEIVFAPSSARLRSPPSACVMATSVARAARSTRDRSLSSPSASPIKDSSPFRSVTRHNTPRLRDLRTSTSSK